MAPAAATPIPVNRVNWVTVKGASDSDRMLWVLWAAQEALPEPSPSWSLLNVSLSHLLCEASPKPHTRLNAP